MSSQIQFPKIIGHRGAKGCSPENTLASFKKAHELGAQWVELDVKETQDGVLIIMHDDDLDRTSNYKGKVAQTPWSIIKTLDAGSWYSKQFSEEKIPSLQEAVQLFESLNLGVNLEIKPCPNRETSTSILVADFIKNNWPKKLPPPLVSSFSMESLKIAKKQNPELIIGLLFENELPSNWKQIARELNASSINIDDKMANQKTIEDILKEGYQVLVYTVNSKERAEELFKLGVSSIFTDMP
ncbi:MAG: glycerophosphoryl diester phosphodiesterase [Bdellovibrionota bacterium]